MKKFLMTIAAAFVAVSMNAQIYLGGSVAFASVSPQGGDSETIFKIMPEIGYNINDEWAVGTVIGFTNNKWDGVSAGSGNFASFKPATLSESAFIFAPYARYTFLKSGKVNLFVDGGLDFMSASKNDATYLGIGLKPGLAVNLTDKMSFVSHLGFVGFDMLNPKGDNNNTSSFGINMDSMNISFGLYFSL